MKMQNMKLMHITATVIYQPHVTEIHLILSMRSGTMSNTGVVRKVQARPDHVWNIIADYGPVAMFNPFVARLSDSIGRLFRSGYLAHRSF